MRGNHGFSRKPNSSKWCVKPFPVTKLVHKMMVILQINWGSTFAYTSFDLFKISNSNIWLPDRQHISSRLWMLYNGDQYPSHSFIDREKEAPEGKWTCPSSPLKLTTEVGKTNQVSLVLNFPPSQINLMTSSSFVMNNPFIVKNARSITTTHICHFHL